MPPMPHKQKIPGRKTLEKSAHPKHTKGLTGDEKTLHQTGLRSERNVKLRELKAAEKGKKAYKHFTDDHRVKFHDLAVARQAVLDQHDIKRLKSVGFPKIYSAWKIKTRGTTVEDTFGTRLTSIAAELFEQGYALGSIRNGIQGACNDLKVPIPKGSDAAAAPEINVAGPSRSVQPEPIESGVDFDWSKF